MTKTREPLSTIKVLFSPDFRAVDDLLRWYPMQTLAAGENWEQMQIGDAIFFEENSLGRSLFVCKISPLLFFEELLECSRQPMTYLTSQDQHYDIEVKVESGVYRITNRSKPSAQLFGSSLQIAEATKRCLYHSIRLCEMIFPRLDECDRFLKLKSRYGG